MARKLSKRQAAAAQTDIPTGCTALYIRVSTDKQVEEGFSLEEQQERLTAYCKAQDWNLCEDHIYIDAGASAKTADRPAFQAMLQTARQGAINRVVATKLDRIARNSRDFQNTVDTLQGCGCDMVLLKESFDSSTPQGKFFLTMLAAVAELEISTIQERTMGGRRQKARQGGYNGSVVPFGYTYDGEGFSIDAGQDATVRRIFAEFNAGDSLTAIAKRLNADETPTAKGGRWYAGTVRYILRNGFYAGLVQYDGQETEGSHKAIIARKVYEQTHARLQALKPGPEPA